MLSFQRDFPGATLIKLEQNYRSTQVILDAANGVIAENARRLGKTLFTAKKGGEPVTLLTALLRGAQRLAHPPRVLDDDPVRGVERSDEHTSEIQSPM